MMMIEVERGDIPMPKIEDGGPAFPVLPPVDETGRSVVGYPYPEAGMSLRDWFAGQALAGLLAGQYRDYSQGNLKEVPDEAFMIADAMLIARKGVSP